MAENKKKRKWLSTQALKEFINDITEEELNAEELYNGTDRIPDPLSMGEEIDDSETELDTLIQEQELFAEQASTSQKLEMQSETASSDQRPSELKQIYDELVVLKKNAEVRIHELELENDELKEKLDFKRIHDDDELVERDEEWQAKVAAIEEEKNEKEAAIARLQQELKEKQKELTDTAERIKKEALEREASVVDLKELTRQLKDYQKKYQEAQEENKTNEKKLVQITTEHDEERGRLEQLKKQYSELEQNYQQLHTLHQKNEAKMVELQAENDVLDELLEEKEQEIEAELTQLKKRTQSTNKRFNN